MAAAFAFFCMLLLSLVIAMLAALQLGDFFMAGDEFIFVIGTVAAFSIIAMGVFAVADATTARPQGLNRLALLLALAALGLVSVPGLVPWIASHSTNPYTIGSEQNAIRLEIIIPALVAVLVQWGLVRRSRLRAAGEEDFTRWPWVTTVVAGFLILNPVGLAFVAAALNRGGSNVMWEFFAAVTGSIAAALVVMAAIECYIRGRMLRRRLLAPPSQPVRKSPR